MKLLFVAVLYLIAAAAPISDFDARADRFNASWNLFYRAYEGCPPEAVYLKDCHPLLGALNRKQFKQARAAAKDLFDLE